MALRDVPAKEDVAKQTKFEKMLEGANITADPIIVDRAKIEEAGGSVEVLPWKVERGRRRHPHRDQADLS